MHEYGLTKRIVQIVNDAARTHGAKRVIRVFLVIGEDSSVIPGSVQLYFDRIAEGTPAQGAKLETRLIKAEMHCPVCHENFHRPRFSFACPRCGALGSPTGLGNDCYVERVELETEDEGGA